jgi:S-adenosylmethionine decarboxylase proenzyme
LLLIPPKPHLIVDFYGCDPERLDDCEGAKELLYQVARDVGATAIGDIFHQFSPHGVTGVLAIAESHISIHTWVECRYAAVDLFLCNASLTAPAVEAAVERIRAFLRAQSSTTSVIQRGAAIS